MEYVNFNENAPTPKRSTQIAEVELVGFEDDVERIIHLLTRGTKDMDIISIIGMPGLGKTTLARKIFKDSSTVYHFDARAWITISQSYNVRELLRDLYRQLTGLKCNEAGQKNGSDIADMLRKCLIGKRYLIVLDDIWDIKPWDELRLCFPIDGNGSRIMLTSRLKQVAQEVMRHSDPYCLRFLTMEESWKLLQKKVFQKESCPPELRDVGLQLAQICKGLPLAIVLIGGVIAKKERNVSGWSEVASNLKSLFGQVENESDLAIQLSYHYLPCHLRHCLLIMGVFREDEKIVVSRLMLLWMAEGFVRCSDHETRLEEVAEGYLMDLICSSLIMVSKKTYNGKLKYLRIHDLVHDFCLKKAKEEKFMQVIGLHNQYPRFSYDGPRVCIHLEKKLKRYLLSSEDTFPEYDSEVERSSFEQNLSSLSAINDHGEQFPEMYTCRFTFPSLGNFKLLRVLDFINCSLTDYHNILQSLVHLRYLRMYCEEFTFEWVSHLCHLETLVVDSSKSFVINTRHMDSSESCVIDTPHVLKMTKLRHVSVAAKLPRDQIATSEEPAAFYKLGNLRTLEKVCVSCKKEVEELVETFPNLQKLLLVLHDKSGEIDSLCLKLELLTQLQSLALCSIFLSITEYNLPSSLKDLTLALVDVSTYTASAIAVLPNLESLSIEECTFEQNEWDVRGVEFPALKFLNFQEADFEEWHVAESSFPILEILVLKICWKLKKIPYNFVDVQTLRSIKVIEGRNSLKVSALEIKEEVEAIAGCDILDLHISPPYSRK